MDTWKISQFCEKHLASNFVGVYPIDQIATSTKCRQLTNCLSANFNFIIMNSDPSSESGTHCMMLMKLSEINNNVFLFDSYGLTSLEYFFELCKRPRV